MPALSQGALNWIKVVTASFISEYLGTCVCHMWRSGFRYDSQFFWGGIPQVFSVECRSWHLLSRWILSRAWIHYLSMCREWIPTTPSLLERSRRRHHRLHGWRLHPPSFYFGVCNSLDHDLVTGTTARTQSNVHTLSCLRLSFFSSSSVCLSPLNPRSSLSRCLTLALVWIDNSDSLSMRSLPSYHWYHF